MHILGLTDPVSPQIIEESSLINNGLVMKIDAGNGKI